MLGQIDRGIGLTVLAAAALIIGGVMLCTAAFAASGSGKGTAPAGLLGALPQWTADDIAGALKLATAIPDLQDPVGAACWSAMAPIGAIVQQHPLPVTLKLATDIQAARLFLKAIKGVCLKPECTQVFSDIANQAGAIATIPLVLSLTSLCAKIP